jgi:hypothetical protein
LDGVDGGSITTAGYRSIIQLVRNFDSWTSVDLNNDAKTVLLNPAVTILSYDNINPFNYIQSS